MNKYYDIVHVMDNMDTALTWMYMYVAVLVKCGKYYNVLIVCVKEDQKHSLHVLQRYKPLVGCVPEIIIFKFIECAIMYLQQFFWSKKDNSFLQIASYVIFLWQFICVCHMIFTSDRKKITSCFTFTLIIVSLNFKKKMITLTIIFSSRKF